MWDDWKIKDRKRITNGKWLKLIMSLVGIFMTSWDIGKKGDQSIAKRLELIRGRDISSSEKRGVT